MDLDHFEPVKNIILDLEDGKTDVKSAINQIQVLTDKEVTEYDLTNYWRSMGIDEFARTLAMPEIQNWQEIDDERALFLIREILENITDSALILRNTNALEKRYKKASGTAMNYVFQDDKKCEREILAKLKKDTTIQL